MSFSTPEVQNIDYNEGNVEKDRVYENCQVYENCIAALRCPKVKGVEGSINMAKYFSWFNVVNMATVNAYKNSWDLEAWNVWNSVVSKRDKVCLKQLQHFKSLKTEHAVSDA